MIWAVLAVLSVLGGIVFLAGLCHSAGQAEREMERLRQQRKEANENR